MFKIFKSSPDKSFLFSSEYGSSNFLPYLTHLNSNTVICKDGTLIKIIKIEGFSFETADDEDLDIKRDLRNLLFKGMNSDNISLYFHTIRKKRKAYPDNYSSMDMPSGFATYLDKKWFAKYKNKNAFSNELYISIIAKPRGVSIDSIASIIDLLRHRKINDSKNKKILDLYDQLEESTGRVLNSLRDYAPHVLSIERTNEGSFSEIAEFFSMILNLGTKSRILANSRPISEQVGSARLYFKRKSITGKFPDGTEKFAGIVSVKEYGPKTWPGILDMFLKMPFEFVITQTFNFTNRQSAIIKMQLQQNRMIQSGDKAISQIYEITEALDKAMSGEIAFGEHHLSVMCIGDDEKQLETILSMAAVELTNTGGIGVREKVNMEPAFWGQFPGNFDFVVRKSTINSMNLACFNSFHNYPTGKEKNNHWGNAVTVFDTTSGTPYYFNFHLRDVGHTTIIGPTGSGKTVLMNFLCGQAQKFKCRLFFFDKDRGAEIFIRALGGEYTVIDPGKKCGFNPLLLSDNGENRTFLTDWIKLMVSTNGELITSDDVKLIASAINGNYKLKPEDRRLENLAAFFGIETPGSIASRLSEWYGNRSLSNVFDNDLDTIDFSKSTIFGFEMGEILKNKACLGPVLNYIFHRINISLDGTPTMIVLDEAWALIDNPVFAPKIKDWLKVLRKLNTFVVFATQSVEDASKSAISDTLIQQTATQIFLPNLKATDIYTTAFMLTEREFQLIKTTDPGSRFFLIKQGKDSVIAKVDLSGMDDIISVLSGRAETVVILDEVRQKFGNDPEVWLPEFVKRVKAMQS